MGADVQGYGAGDAAHEDRWRQVRELLAERDRRYEERWQSLLATHARTEAQLEHRLAGMNEFRQAIEDTQARMLPRAEYAVEHQRLQEHAQAASLRLEMQITRLGQDLQLLREDRARWLGGLTIAGLLLTLASAVLGGVLIRLIAPL